MNIPFENSYWVIENKLLAGCVPVDFSFKKYEKIRRLLEFEINTVIDLRDDFLRTNLMNYNIFIKDKNKDVKIINFKIKDFSCPSIELVKEILDFIDLEMFYKRKTYIHCLGGIGRTGTIIGCYLIRHQIANKENVLEYLQNLRLQSGCKKIKSPETKDQIDRVINWQD